MESQEPYFLAELGPTLPHLGMLLVFLTEFLWVKKIVGSLFIWGKKKKLIFQRESKENSTPLLEMKFKKKKKNAPQKKKKEKKNHQIIFYFFLGHKIS